MSETKGLSQADLFMLSVNASQKSHDSQKIHDAFMQNNLFVPFLPAELKASMFFALFFRIFYEKRRVTTYREIFLMIGESLHAVNTDHLTESHLNYNSLENDVELDFNVNAMIDDLGFEDATAGDIDPAAITDLLKQFQVSLGQSMETNAEMSVLSPVVVSPKVVILLHNAFKFRRKLLKIKRNQLIFE